MADRRLLLVTVEADPPPFPSLRTIFGEVFPTRGWQVDWVLAGRPSDWNPKRGEVFHLPPTEGRAGAALAGLMRERAAATAALRERVARGEYDALVVRDDPLLALLFFGAARRGGTLAGFQVSHLKEEEALVAARRGVHGGRAANTVKALVALVLRGAALRRADVILPISRELGRRLRVGGERVVVVPEGAPRSLTEAEGPAFAAAPSLVYVGTLSRARRLEFMVHVAAELAPLVPGAKVRLTGPEARAGDADFLRSAARAAGVENLTVEAPVPAAQVPEMLRQAWAGACPLPPDAFLQANSPIKLFEYMAAGIPVIGTATPEQSEALSESGGGVVAPWEARAFAAAAAGFLRDPERARRSGELGRAWVKANRTLESIGERLEAEIGARLRASANRSRRP